MQSKFFTNSAGAELIEIPSDNGPVVIRDVTYGEVFATGKTIPINSGMRNGYKWHWFNWNSLTEEEKIECGSQVWMFDEENQVWHPMTRLYTGG